MAHPPNFTDTHVQLFELYYHEFFCDARFQVKAKKSNYCETIILIAVA